MQPTSFFVGAVVGGIVGGVVATMVVGDREPPSARADSSSRRLELAVQEFSRAVDQLGQRTLPTVTLPAGESGAEPKRKPPRSIEDLPPPERTRLHERPETPPRAKDTLAIQRSLQEHGDDMRSLNRSMFLANYREVLDRFGWPDYVQLGEGHVIFRYRVEKKQFVVRFINGQLMSINGS
ncbi:MAG: hypothetical protein OER88_00565 [Planctomycetota bacterium]|nr:hypothetical protein [Planctomycetota bacterium]